MSTPENHDALAGLRVLVVEDNQLVGRAVCRLIERASGTPIGPVASVDEACRRIDEDAPDVAVLDFDIIGGTSQPVAERLLAAGRAFVFLSGFHAPVLPPHLAHAEVLRKPIRAATLFEALRRSIENGAKA